MKDILIHDSHCEDNTLQLKLAMMDNEDGFPVALGVIRDVAAPTYNDAVNEQIEEIKAKKPYHNLKNLKRMILGSKIIIDYNNKRRT